MLFVTLFTRVWIEILAISLQAVVRLVTLFTRVWIEISLNLSSILRFLVTLFTRVWIEILLICREHRRCHCHSLYESVNWNIFHQLPYFLFNCHSLYESVNWNFCCYIALGCHIASLSLRECELKFNFCVFPLFFYLSLSLRECELKSFIYRLCSQNT